MDLKGSVLNKWQLLFLQGQWFSCPSMDSDSVSRGTSNELTHSNGTSILVFPSPLLNGIAEAVWQSLFLPVSSKTFKEVSTIPFCQDLTKFKLFLISNPNRSPTLPASFLFFYPVWRQKRAAFQPLDNRLPDLGVQRYLLNASCVQPPIRNHRNGFRFVPH